MVKRQSFRSLSHRIISSYRPAMALLNKEPFFGGFHGFRRVHTANVKPRFPAKVSIDAGSSLWINASKVLSLKGSYDHCDSLRMKAIDGLSLNGCSDHFDRLGRRADDGFQKAHALAPYPQLARDSEVGLEEAKGASTRSMSDRGPYKGGKSLGFLDQPVPNKLIVAVDVDEVLGNFVSALNKFIADRYSSNHSVSEYHVYEFFRIWNCSRDEADIRVHEFFKTPYFKKGIHPIPGARQALHKLSAFCDLSVVTSRQNAIKDHTIEWIEEHYPGLFQEIHFGNHFALDGKSRPKSDICRSLGAQVLIDDNPRYAIECAEVGIRVLLFDYQNSYPWCKTGSDNLHPLVTRVHDWEEVEQRLASWVLS